MSKSKQIFLGIASLISLIGGLISLIGGLISPIGGLISLISGLKSPRKKKFFFCCCFCLLDILIHHIWVHSSKSTLFCMEEQLWSPSYYTRGALKTGGGCRASIAPAWIRRVDVRTRVCVDAWTRQQTNFFLSSSSR